jgi:hypothetical protein
MVFGLLGGLAMFGGPTGAGADEAPPPIEENYDYPGADRILAERGIKLIKGDGRILFVDCVVGANQAKVESRRWPGTRGHFCFTIKGTKGYLTLEIPEAYVIWSDQNHALNAKIKVADQTSTVNVPKDDFVGIGEGGDDPNSGPATILELRVAS